MAGRSPTQLLDIHLVEDRRIEAEYFQDYAKVHERLDRHFEKSAKPLSPEEAEAARTTLLAWLHGQFEKNVPAERLTQWFRCALGHICVEMCLQAELPVETVAANAYEEFKRRGWAEARYDEAEAAEAAGRVAEAERKAALERSEAKRPVHSGHGMGSTNAPGKTTVARKISRKEDRAMSNIDEPGKATVVPEQTETKKPETEAKEVKMATEKKAPAAKKPAVKKATAEKKAPAAKKPAAKKAPAAKKPAAKKVAEKKAPAAKKPAVKKAAVAKKPAVKKVAEKKPVAKKAAAAKKPVAKKAAVAKKPVAKKAAPAKKPVAKKAAVAKKPAVKKVAEKKPVAKKAAVAKKPAVKKVAVKKAPAKKAAPAKKPAAPKKAPAKK